MTAERFIALAEKTYGKYNETQKRIVERWLSDYKEQAISMIWAEVLKILSWTYKTPPGPKELEDAMKIVRRYRSHELESPPVPLLEEDAMPREELEGILSGLMKKLKFNR